MSRCCGSTLSRFAANVFTPHAGHRAFSSCAQFAMLHHLMVGTWTPPGAIFTLQFDDEKLTLNLIKKTEIPHDEPISWITFDVSAEPTFRTFSHANVKMFSV